jgi:hypothetical protein
MTRRPPSYSDKLASVLLMLKIGDEWLIPEPVRSKGSTREILSCAVWDHITPVANGGGNDPRNLQPLSSPAHAIKTAKDVSGIAKGKRLARTADETRRIILARIG